jgi:hypothetical protein
MGELLDVQGLVDVLNEGSSSSGDVIFRLEQIPEYTVESDGGDFQAWSRGVREPNWDRKRGYTDLLEARTAAGVTSQRVRVFSPNLTDYERYACEWGYAINGQYGEDIRVLHRGEHRVPPLLGFDYWLLGRETVVRMHYDEVGRFCGAELAPELLRQVLRERDALWQVAEPFDTWYQQHPEFRRRLAA